MIISDRLKTKLIAAGTTLTKTDRIITGNPAIQVLMKFNQSQVASCTNGRDITIFPQAIPDVGSSSTLVTLLGLNYHEVAHVLLSPRNDHNFRVKVQRSGYHMAFNMLEDQRIEALFGARYGSASKFFAAPVMKLIVENKEAWPTAHLLTYGRRYLPLEIRNLIGAQFTGSDDLKDEAEIVIDRFRKITFKEEREYDTAYRLVARFHEILSKLSQELGPDCLKPLQEKGCASELEEGRMDKESVAASSRRLEDNDVDQDAAEEKGRDGSGFWDEEDEDEDGESESGGSDDDDYEDDDDSDETDSGSVDGEDQEDEPSAAEPGGGGADPDSEAGGESNLPGDPSGSGSSSGDGEDGDDSGNSPNGLGAGDQEGVTDHAPNLTELAQEIVDAVNEDPEVQEAVNMIRAAMDDLRSLDLDLPQLEGVKVPVSEKLASASRAAAVKLQRMFEDLEAGWAYGADTGRLNAGAVMQNPNDPDVWFDDWTEGHTQDAGLEAVIAIDVSGSMASNDPESHASEALWMLSRSLEEIDAKVSAIAFGSNTEKLKGRDETVSASEVTMYPRDAYSTVPAGALIEARRILGESDRPNKLFVVLTDGVWSSPTGQPLRPLVEAIDATKVFLGLKSSFAHDYVKAFDVAATLKDASGLVSVVQSFVESMLRSAGSR